MRILATFGAAFVFIAFAVATAAGPTRGRVCLAPLIKETAKQETVPWQRLGDSDSTNYSVRVDERHVVSLSLVKASWIRDLDLNSEHSLVILADGNPVESFKFRFDDVNFRDPTRPDLCLFVNSLYLTWQLWRVEQTGDWCPCWSTEEPRGR